MNIDVKTVRTVFRLPSATPFHLACGIVWLCLLMTLRSFGADWDFPILQTGSPTYTKLYSDVLVGNTVAPTDNFKLADETLSAVYAYLHPQSPYRYNAAYLGRLRLLLDTRFAQWNAGQDLNDMAGCFQAIYAYMLLKHYRSGDIADKSASWEAAIRVFCDDALASNPLLYDSGISAAAWLNGDIRLAMGIYFAGVALNNGTYQTKARTVMDNVFTGLTLNDGGTHYVGFNNETPTYHDVSLAAMIWWWKLTNSAPMAAAIGRTIHYVPLSVEPSGCQEQSSAIAYKHMYNGMRGLNSALLKAYLYGDGYNYFFGKQVEASYSGVNGQGLLCAMLYRPGLVAKTPPSDFVVYDRAIMGPRGRYADWAFVGTTRDPQRPGPEDIDQGYQGGMCGRNTFVGAMTLGTFANGTSLNAALDGVAPEFKFQAGPETNWARGNVYRFLSQDQKASTIVRKNFATLACVYKLSSRTSAAASGTWGAALPWTGKQLWVMTNERMIGLVQITADQAQTVYGLDTRFVLCGGRKSVTGSYKTLTASDKYTYQFGNLMCKIRQETFGGAVTTERFGIQDGAGDDYSAMIRLHDAQDFVNDTSMTVAAGTSRWVLFECTRAGTAFAASAINPRPNDGTWGSVEIVEGTRRMRAIQNMSSATHNYTGGFNVGTNGYKTASLHCSWTPTVTPATITNGTISIALAIPAYGNVIVVCSDTPDDHISNQKVYEDIFP